MDAAKRLLQSIIRNGTIATVKTFTGGTQCPCMISRGSEAPAYSLDWHRRNPTATDCEGIGEINATETTVTIKTMPIDAQAIGDAVKRGGAWVDVGEIKTGDLALYGAVKTSDGTNYSFDGLTDKNEITLIGYKYAVKYVLRLPIAGEIITAAIVRRLE